MKLGATSIFLGAIFVFAVGAVASSGKPAIKICVTEKPTIGEQRIGYELIDVMRGEAWVTFDWTLDSYSEYSLGITSLNWFKNKPRLGYGARSGILKSPDCANDGEFSYQHMHGRSFFHIADITGIGTTHGENNELRGASVKKFHYLEFGAGQTVTFLVSPDQEFFVRVNRPVGSEQSEPELPESWSIKDFDLTSAWQAELFDNAQVYQVKDGTSFQGPVAPPTDELSKENSANTQIGQDNT